MIQSLLDDLRSQGFTPKSLLDVGAHLGSFSAAFLKTFPDCAPTLVEPNPFCQDDLAKLPYERHAVAASLEPGMGELFLTKEWLQSTGSSLYRENTTYFRDEVVVRKDVEKVRLDDLLKGRSFDFVKINTQGSELDVLKGGRKVLSTADHILISIPPDDYNLGGPTAEAVFSELEAMGFQCTDDTDVQRRKGAAAGGTVKTEFLFQRRAKQRTKAPKAAAQGASPPTAVSMAPPLGEPQDSMDVRLVKLAEGLRQEGRHGDAIILFEHLTRVLPTNEAVLRGLVTALSASGRNLEALERLAALRALQQDMGVLLGFIQEQSLPAIAKFNAHLQSGEIAQAEPYAAALVALVPHSEDMLRAAMSCNQALGRGERTAGYARTLIQLNPNDAAARAALVEYDARAGDLDSAAEHRAALALAAGEDVHPLLRLRDLHDAASALLCRPLTPRSETLIQQSLTTAKALTIEVPPDSEWAAWEKHYRALMDAIDVAAVHAPTPSAAPEPEIACVTSSGKALDWDGVCAAAKRLGAKAVFFVAADEAYVDLYARWYALSILKHADVPCLIVVHVIGGAERLGKIAKSVGVKDKRLIYAGDQFDAAAVTTKCYDAPPKGLSAKPVAHFQCVRFTRLGALLDKLKVPVFVSDIDLLLQRGVEDLLDRCDGADVVFNENHASTNAGSRLTANLLLVKPTANADLFLRFLSNQLEVRLAGAEVTRWIDQLELLLARHHLAIHGDDPRIDYFDTSTDINNVMYTAYQDHPFRFLSLYHGFDTSSLEDNPRVLEGGAERTALARSMAGRTADKLKVAVVLTGHMRCWKTVFANFKENIIDRYSPDIFIHTWNDEGYWVPADAATSVKEGAPLLDEADVRAHYRPIDMVIEDFADFEAAFAKRAEAFPVWHARPRNVISMFYKMTAGMELLEKHVKETGEPYDLVIRMRPDMILHEPLPDFDPSQFYTLNHRNHLRQGTGDMFHVGKAEAINAFLTLYGKLEEVYAKTGVCCPHIMSVHQIEQLGLPWREFFVRKTLQHTPKGQYAA